MRKKFLLRDSLMSQNPLGMFLSEFAISVLAVCLFPNKLVIFFFEKAQCSHELLGNRGKF